MRRETIQFDRPLIGVRLAAALERFNPVPLPAQPARDFEAELEAARREGYQKGHDEANAFLSEQLMVQRQEVVHLCEGALRHLTRQEETLALQASQLLPDLVMGIVRRVLAGCEPDAQQVARLVEQTMNETTLESGPLEVALCARDLKLLEGLDPDMHRRHPQISFRADESLRPGDCQVRGRFGLIDGRVSTKLKAVGALLSAA